MTMKFLISRKTLPLLGSLFALGLSQANAQDRAITYTEDIAAAEENKDLTPFDHVSEVFHLVF